MTLCFYSALNICHPEWPPNNDVEFCVVTSLAKAEYVMCLNHDFSIIVELKDLWKIKAPLGSVEGFNVQAFDKLIEVCY
jgi:hypothetical protein